MNLQSQTVWLPRLYASIQPLYAPIPRDPMPPKGVGFPDPLSGTLKEAVEQATKLIGDASGDSGRTGKDAVIGFLQTLRITKPQLFVATLMRAHLPMPQPEVHVEEMNITYKSAQEISQSLRDRGLPPLETLVRVQSDLVDVPALPAPEAAAFRRWSVHFFGKAIWPARIANTKLISFCK